MSKNILSPEMYVLYPNRDIIAVQPTNDSPYRINEIHSMGGIVAINHNVKLPDSDEGLNFQEHLVMALGALGVITTKLQTVMSSETQGLFPLATSITRAHMTACDKLDLPEATWSDPTPLSTLFDLGVYRVMQPFKPGESLSAVQRGYVGRLSKGEQGRAIAKEEAINEHVDARAVKTAISRARTILHAERNDKLLTLNAYLAGILPLESPSPIPPAA